MLLLVAFAAAEPPPAHVEAQARATVRIERAVRVDLESWERLPAAARREMLVSDEQGRPLLLRLLELP